MDHLESPYVDKKFYALDESIKSLRFEFEALKKYPTWQLSESDRNKFDEEKNDFISKLSSLESDVDKSDKTLIDLVPGFTVRLGVLYYNFWNMSDFFNEAEKIEYRDDQEELEYEEGGVE